MSIRAEPGTHFAQGLACAAPRAARWALSLVAIGCLLPFASLLWPDQRVIPANEWISCDYASYQLPVRRFAREEFLAGRFPTWVPYLACGAPLHASMQASLCHPLVTPLVLVFGADYGLKAALFVHLALGWIGMYRLARAFRISAPSSAFAALLTTWSGFSIGQMMSGHVTISIQYSLIPWFFLALDGLLRRPAAFSAAFLAGLSACLAVSGQPQIFFYTLLAGAIWTAGSLAAGRASEHRGKIVRWGALAVVTGLLLAAVQIIPTAELVSTSLGGSKRSSPEHATQYCLDGSDILRLVSPNILGNPFTGPEPLDRSDHYHERVVYLGLLPLLLVPVGLSRKSCPRWQWGAAAIVLLLFAIALGRGTPAFDLLAAAIPGLRLFRCHGRAFCVATVLIALGAAHGLDALVRGDRIDKGANLLKLSALVWAMVNLAGVAINRGAETLPAHRMIAYARQNAMLDITISTTFFLLAASLLVIARAWGKAFPLGLYAAAIALSAADLGYFNVRGFRLAPFSCPAVPDELSSLGPPIRFVDATDFPGVGRAPLQYSRLVPTALSAHRSLVGTNDGGLLPEATERLFDRIEQGPRIALQIAGCSHGCAAKTGEWVTLPPALPRVRFLTREAEDLARTPIDRFDAARVTKLRRSLTGDIQIVTETPHEISIDLVAPSSGWLVLADTWYPGWRCRVDGCEQSLIRANEVFRGVAVATAGKHRIVFSFSPRSFLYGAACTLIGAVLFAALIIIGLRTGRKPLLGESPRLALVSMQRGAP